MKKILLSLIAFAIATVSFAQSSLLATLSHEGQITTYYGTNALIEAVNAAVDGDVVTLSSGQFNAVNIEKAITLRGSGMNVSNEHDMTMIVGQFNIDDAAIESGRIAFEGLYINNDVTYNSLRNAQFLKCRFDNFTYGYNPVIENSSFIHCRFCEGITIWGSSNTTFINCVLSSLHSSSSANVECDNCFVKFLNRDASNVPNAYYKNCVIHADAYAIPSSSLVNNCIVNFDGMLKEAKKRNNTNIVVEDFSTIFKTYNGSTDDPIEDAEMLELTDEAKTTYLGMDGKEVGLYGGNLPYDENPSNPQITKCNVAAKSTADGKLSVDIEVKGAE